MFQIRFTNEAKEQFINISQKEPKKLKIIKKTINLLSTNPKYPSLNTHKYIGYKGYEDIEIFEAYVENHTLNAYRIFWCYGVGKDIITIISIQHHP